eukprot:g7251.t1
MEDWAAQYEDDPALLESPAQKQAAENNEWRRTDTDKSRLSSWTVDCLEVTKGNTQKFAKAHSTLREAAAQFYIINGATLAIPSLLESPLVLTVQTAAVCNMETTPRKRLRPLSSEPNPDQRRRQLEAWLCKNQAQLQQAERLLSARWADPTLFSEKMELCQKVLQVMKRVLGGESAESKSLLLLGEPGSGKTQAVDWLPQWAEDIELGRKPTWFMWQCLPVVGKVLKGHTEESLSSAFYRLISYKLVNFIPVSSSDVSSRYRPCESQVDEEYRQWVEDMEKTESAMLQNPLKNMPEEAANFNKVLSWAVKAMVASMLISLILWIIGFVVIWVEDLSSCSEVRSWLRFILVIRAFMPFLVMCCIIPIQELCCEAV